HPDLARAAAARAAEIAALDTELAELTRQLETLLAQARQVDVGLAADEHARAERARAEDLAHRLAATDPITVQEADHQHQVLRDQSLADGGAEHDLSIVSAQLDALTTHLRTTRRTEPSALADEARS
ncbi:hypothetical protein, partial [Amycolatopsis sp. NPDC051903]|uniref:hypothetical protein n=1 Tax=Amycolatopsis sp. NPDC051903 TaxID=3363936 RepID=UPI0037A2DAD8